MVEPTHRRLGRSLTTGIRAGFRAVVITLRHHEYTVSLQGHSPLPTYVPVFDYTKQIQENCSDQPPYVVTSLPYQIGFRIWHIAVIFLASYTSLQNYAPYADDQ